MDNYLPNGSLLDRDSGTRKGERRDSSKAKTIQEVIDSTVKEIESVFGQVKKKPAARAKAA